MRKNKLRVVSIAWGASPDPNSCCEIKLDGPLDHYGLKENDSVTLTKVEAEAKPKRVKGAITMVDSSCAGVVDLGVRITADDMEALGGIKDVWIQSRRIDDDTETLLCRPEKLETARAILEAIHNDAITLHVIANTLSRGECWSEGYIRNLREIANRIRDIP